MLFVLHLLVEMQFTPRQWPSCTSFHQHLVFCSLLQSMEVSADSLTKEARSCAPQYLSIFVCCVSFELPSIQTALLIRARLGFSCLNRPTLFQEKFVNCHHILPSSPTASSIGNPMSNDLKLEAAVAVFCCGTKRFTVARFLD